MEQESAPRGQRDEDGISPPLPEALAGLDAKARSAISQVIVLHREFPAWAVWLPHGGRQWIAVRPAAARAPGPDLPMIWVHAAVPAELAERMRGVDGQLAGRDR